MTGCPSYRHELGAHVLGGLPAGEAHAVDAHLDDCAACRAERAELAGAVSLLGLAEDAPPRVPARVRDRVVAGAAARRTRRRWAATLVAAATVAALAGTAVGWQLAPATQEAITVPLAEVEASTASGWATFTRDDDAVIVQLEVEGLEPLEEPGTYEAWLSTDDERVVSIGQFDAVSVSRQTIAAELSAPGSLADYEGFWITAEPDRRDPAHAGPTVLRAPVPDPP